MLSQNCVQSSYEFSQHDDPVTPPNNPQSATSAHSMSGYALNHQTSMIDPSSESRGYDGQPQDVYGGYGMAPQGYSVSGSAGMPPGSAGHDQGSAGGYGGPRHSTFPAPATEVIPAVASRVTEFPNFADHRLSLSNLLSLCRRLQNLQLSRENKCGEIRALHSCVTYLSCIGTDAVFFSLPRSCIPSRVLVGMSCPVSLMEERRMLSSIGTKIHRSEIMERGVVLYAVNATVV